MALDWALETYLFQSAVLLATGLLGAALARWARLPAAVGGVLLGLLLGPTVAGRLAPEAYRALSTGGPRLLHWANAFDADRGDARQRLEETDVSEVRVEHFDAETARRRRARFREAERRHGVVFGFLAGPTLALVLLGAAVGPPGADARRNERGGHVLAGMLTLLVPVALAAVASWALFQSGWIDWTALDATYWAFAVSVGTGIAASGECETWRRHSDRDTPREALGRVATVNISVAITATAVVVATTGAERETDPSLPSLAGWIRPVAAAVGLVGGGLFVVRPTVDRLLDRWTPQATADRTAVWIASVGLGWLALAYGACLAIGDPVAGPLLGTLVIGRAVGASRHAPEALREGIRQVATWLAAPLLFAIVGTRVDLLQAFDWLLAVVIFLVCTHGKLLGAVAGLRLGVATENTQAVDAGLRWISGATLPLAFAYLVQRAGLIGGPAFAALVLAILATAALSAPAARLLKTEAAQTG